MSETAASEPQNTESGKTPRRKRPPTWGIIVFLLLLGGMAVVNQLVSSSGPQIEWIENDLDAALAQVSKSKPRVFLYLYEPDDKIHQLNERQVFTKLWARKPLADAVCCRIALGNDRESLRLRREFSYQDTPLLMILTKDRKPLSRTSGAVSEKMFFTDITQTIEHSLSEPSESQNDK